MYAADVSANVYKANILIDIVSKVMADVPSARNAELPSQLSEDETESPSFETRINFIELLVRSRLSWMNFRALVFSCHVKLHEHFL